MQQDSADTPLTDLCAICHVNPIKYTCPRDGIHTCSLPCVRRHKQWAQCSGVRDPAEYRKRSELATSTSIDKDFNFITKVERSISRADDIVAERGIDLVPARLRSKDTRPKVELETEARGVKVIKAPKGLSRSKQNKTHWATQSKCIVWTVEWIFPDGRRIMSTAPETRSVRDLSDSAAASKRNAKKRKRSSIPQEQKRELGKKDKFVVETGSSDKVTTSTSHTVPEELEDSAQQVPDQNPQCATHAEVEARTDTSTEQPDPISIESEFYLHRPQTESKYKCLIPISGDRTLQDILKNRTLIEFPTIYIHNVAPDRLSPPFISEEEYLRRHGDDIPINVSAPMDTTIAADEDVEEGELISDQTSLDIDETKVLEVLAKDLGT